MTNFGLTPLEEMREDKSRGDWFDRIPPEAWFAMAGGMLKGYTLADGLAGAGGELSKVMADVSNRRKMEDRKQLLLDRVGGKVMPRSGHPAAPSRSMRNVQPSTPGQFGRQPPVPELGKNVYTQAPQMRGPRPPSFDPALAGAPEQQYDDLPSLDVDPLPSPSEPSNRRPPMSAEGTDDPAFSESVGNSNVPKYGDPNYDINEDNSDIEFEHDQPPAQPQEQPQPDAAPMSGNTAMPGDVQQMIRDLAETDPDAAWQLYIQWMMKTQNAEPYTDIGKVRADYMRGNITKDEYNMALAAMKNGGNERASWNNPIPLRRLNPKTGRYEVVMGQFSNSGNMRILGDDEGNPIRPGSATADVPAGQMARDQNTAQKTREAATAANKYRQPVVTATEILRRNAGPNSYLFNPYAGAYSWTTMAGSAFDDAQAAAYRDYQTSQQVRKQFGMEGLAQFGGNDTTMELKVSSDVAFDPDASWTQNYNQINAYKASIALTETQAEFTERWIAQYGSLGNVNEEGKTFSEEWNGIRRGIINEYSKRRLGPAYDDPEVRMEAIRRGVIRFD